MISRTKVDLTAAQIAALCKSAGFSEIENIQPLGAGEFNAVYAFDADGGEYALKIAPGADTPVMTYETNMMRSELFWYEQLRTHTDVEIPEVVYTDLSRSLVPSDFFIMRRVPGAAMYAMDFTAEEQAEARKLMPQIGTKMHRIAHDAFGYPQNGLHKTWAQALQSMTEAMVRDAAAMGQPCTNGEKTLQYIQKHWVVLERACCCMVNFDLWESNVICHRTGGGVHFVMIDPERSFWGDPIMDFICFEPDQPLRQKTASLQAYNELAEHPVTVGPEEEIRYAFAQAYLGVIMEVERYYRYVPGDEGWTRNDRVCEGLFQSAFSVLENA